MQRHYKWIKPLARAGYSARGLVYLIIGLLAVFAALGSAEKTDTKGAVEKLFEQPFGTALIWILVIGLAGYVMWRLIQSLLDTDNHGWKPKGLAVRLGLLASAATYTTLIVYSLSLLGIFGGQEESSGSRGPVGDRIAEIIGNDMVSLGLAIIFIGIAIAHWYKALSQKYEDHFRADHDAMRFIHPVSMTGLIARGIVFSVIALLLFYRFLSGKSESDSPPGIKDAMGFVQDLPMGNWLLVALGLGIIAFSAYSFIEAKWRRINVEDAG